MLRFVRAFLTVTALLCVVAASANAQVNSRKMTSAEQAFVDRLAAEFAKVLPPVPAGWTEVERRIFDAGGMTSDWDAPIQAEYEWLIVRADVEARQEVVRKREQEMADKNRDAFEAATARNQKLIEEYAAKLMAAAGRNDEAAQRRLQAELEKKMGDGMPAVSGSAPELSDTDARIHISINPYSAPVLDEKQMQPPSGFSWVGRREPHVNSSAREGVTRYLIGKWAANTVGSGHTLKYTPNKGAVVYGIVVEIEARADRADALFKAMSIERLKALLQ